MSIKFNKESANGVTADFWVCAAIHSYRVGNSDVFETSAQYDLYLSAEAFAAGKAPLSRSAAQVVSKEPLSNDLSVGEMVALFDDLVIKEPVTEEVEAVEVETAVEGEEELAEPRRPGRSAEPRVVPGGPLAGGVILRQ